jgi:hypothetical protein
MMKRKKKRKRVERREMVMVASVGGSRWDEKV